MIDVQIKGLDKLVDKLKKSPEKMLDVIEKHLGRSLAMAQGEAMRRTPVDTGLLRSSIGGAQGYSQVSGLKASVGTNVKYAYFVEVMDKNRHPVGQSRFMEEGAKAAVPFIQGEMEQAMGELASFITT